MALRQVRPDGYNRMVRAVNVQGGGGESYGYDPENRRVYRWLANGEEQIDFYDLSGRRVETWRFVSTSWPRWQLASTNVYFAGRLIVSGGKAVAIDRLGSIRTRAEWQVYTAVWVERHKYYPYGEERETTISNREKFATYHRDQSTNLDYAMNRYYAWPSGRFATPDPYKASAGLTDPGSWNRYAYTHGDPVNFNDPTGLFIEPVAQGSGRIDFTPDLLHLSGPFDAHFHVSEGGAAGALFFHAALNKAQIVADVKRERMEAAAATTLAMREMLNKALDELHADCVKAFADKGLTMDKLRRDANKLTFYNAQGPTGGLAMGQIVAGAGTETISQFASRMVKEWPNAQALTIEVVYPGKEPVYLPHVVLTAGFYSPQFVGDGARAMVLVHEALHYSLQLNDHLILGKFGVPASGGNASESLTAWLQRDCNN